MGNLTNYITVSITKSAAGPTRQSFDTGLILTATGWGSGERTRVYTDIDAVFADFADTTSPEYRAANALFEQSPAPKKVKFGKLLNKPTMKYELASVSPTSNAGHVYKTRVRGQGFADLEVTYTADSGPTDAEYAAGMFAALNAVASKNYAATLPALVVADTVFTADNTTEIFTATAHGLLTGDGPVQVSNSGGALPSGLLAATDYWVIRIDADTFYLATSLANAMSGTHLNISTNGTGTQTLADVATTARAASPITVTGSAAGNWFTIEPVSRNTQSVKMTHADPGIAADLSAIKLDDPDFYMVFSPFNSLAMGGALAAWVESNKRYTILESCDTSAATTVAGNGDLPDAVFQLGYTRTSAYYRAYPSQMFGAALMSVMTLDPGTETWADKTLVGQTPDGLSDTERAHLVARYCNGYERVAGVGITFDGRSASGDFTDTIRGLDAFADDAQKSIFSVKLQRQKIGMTRGGIARIETELRGAFTRFTAGDDGVGLFNPGTLQITVPDPADISSTDRSNRTLNGIKAAVQLAGAVHRVNVAVNVTA